MPNTWLEGWARGVPALTLSFDPDGRIAAHGLGVEAGGDCEDFVAGGRGGCGSGAPTATGSDRVRAYVADAHGRRSTTAGRRWSAAPLAS